MATAYDALLNVLDLIRFDVHDGHISLVEASRQVDEYVFSLSDEDYASAVREISLPCSWDLSNWAIGYVVHGIKYQSLVR